MSLSVLLRRCWALAVLGLLLSACQHTPAALPGPAVVVLSDELLTAAPPPISLRPDSIRPGQPALYLYLHPRTDTAGVLWLRQLARLPTGGWQVDAASGGRLRGQPVRYVQARRVAITNRRQPHCWEAQLISLAYPQLPPGLGPNGLNEQLRKECFAPYHPVLYLWFEPQPAYDSLPLAARRRLTDTVVLYRRRPTRLLLLRPPGYRTRLLSLTQEELMCASRPTISTDLYGGADGARKLSPGDDLFRPALRWRLTQVVLQLVDDTRRRHHWPMLLPAQRAEFHRRFTPFQEATFTAQGLRLEYATPLRPIARPEYDPLGAVLPAGCRPLVLLVPYRVLTPYLQPEP